MGMIDKLKSTRGESLGEAFAAILVAAIGIAMLAVMITTASSITGRNRSAIRDYYAGNNVLELQIDDGKNVAQKPGTVTVAGWTENTKSVDVDVWIHNAAGKQIALYTEKP